LPELTRKNVTDTAEVTAAVEEKTGGRRRKGAGLDAMVLPELKQLASTLGLRGTGAMRKGQLIAAIQTAQGGGHPGGASATAPDAASAASDTQSPRGAHDRAPRAERTTRRRQSGVDAALEELESRQAAVTQPVADSAAATAPSAAPATRTDERSDAPQE
jgi:transcription termination factor Rho